MTRRKLSLGLAALALLFALSVIPRSSDRTGVAWGAAISPTTTTETVGEITPTPTASSPDIAPANPLPVTKVAATSALSHFMAAATHSQQRQLRRLHRETTWWRAYAVNSAKLIGTSLHFARLSPVLTKSKQQKWTAVHAAWKYGTLAKRREAEHFAYLMTGKRLAWRALQKATYSQNDYEQAKRLAVRWQQKLDHYYVYLGHNPESALEYAARYWRVSASWLIGCARTEGGLGPMKWNGGVYDSDPYHGPTYGSGAYGTMQFMRTTFESNVPSSGAPRPWRWNDALDQAMTAAHMFKEGLAKANWTGTGC